MFIENTNEFFIISKMVFLYCSNRAYFSSISILLPSSWSDSQQYGPSTGELYENSHFRILNDYPRYDTPSVFRPSTVCGETGGYGLFSPAHFTDSQLFTQNSGPYGKVTNLPTGCLITHYYVSYISFWPYQIKICTSTEFCISNPIKMMF